MQNTNIKRTDYTKHLRPRSSMRQIDSFSRPAAAAPKPLPKPLPPTADHYEQMIISIHFNLPDFNSWRTVVFARQYPYLALMGATIAILAVLFLGNALTFLWHFSHQPHHFHHAAPQVQDLTKEAPRGPQ